MLDQYMASSRVVNGATAKCYTHSCAGPWQVGGVVCCSRKTDDEMLMTRSLNVALKATEQNLIVYTQW